MDHDTPDERKYGAEVTTNTGPTRMKRRNHLNNEGPFHKSKAESKTKL